MIGLNHPARGTDISTSHEAAVHVVSSGLQALQQDRAACAVKQNPGLTSMELAKATGHDRYMLARRLPELLEDGRVWRGPKKPCEVSGRSACTWWPVAPGENLALGL
ncbi:winged helix-turn-helix domain-containing protein [Stenotrophomonas rhizophila]|uniref:winged helix-turn-helix domain-containing protein n=1 Tax=Stenotrophomonas rhizophila TaxID=216778 RepID=UPI0028ABE797|nr:winged helix-turn-helix domain-containing protein [Stenotrophomonas rhizophila]